MATLTPSPKIDLSEDQFEILTAAGKILTQSGIAGLTIPGLAREMNCSEGHIYSHFLTPEDIVVALLDYLNYDMDMRYVRTLNGTADTEDLFKRLFRNQAAFFIENPYFAIAVFSDGLMEECTRINNRISTIMETKMSHLMPIIVQGQESGVFRKDLSPEALAHIVMGAFRLLLYKWRVANFKFNLKRRNEDTIESVLVLIKA